jgi:putative ABC transport system permease protein
MPTLIQDLRYALRTLRKSPAFTIIAVLTLALGIGANTAIFSLVNAVLLKMLPVKDPGRLVIVGDPLEVHSRSMGDPRVELFSYPLYRGLNAGNQVFSGMLASGEAHNQRVAAAQSGREITNNATGVLVSGNYFSVLGVNALYGRVLTPEDDDAPNAHPVAVISYGFWKDKMAQSPVAVGQSIRINNYPFTIVGVAPPGFYGDTVGDSQDFWVPVTMEEELIPGRKWLENYESSWLHCIGRLKPGVNVDQARANINLLLQQLVNGPLGSKLNKSDLAHLKQSKIQVSEGGGGFSELRGDFRQPLLLLMSIVMLVLVIAAVNVANLMLARASARKKEIAVRLAIGATAGRVIRQLLTESIFLSFLGGALGLLVAQWGTGALLHLSRNDQLEASPDLRVFLFTAAVCVFTGVLFGLIPALRLRRVAVAPTLKSGAQAGKEMHAGWNWGKLLVTAQVAVSLLVLFAAGLLVRTLRNLRNVDLGYDRQHLLLVLLDPIAGGYTKLQVSNFADDLSRRLASLPGVKAVTYSKNGLFSGSDSGNSIKVEGYVSRSDADLDAAFDQVGPQYFSSIGIPLLLGRDIGLNDTATSARVAVINEAMAKFYFGAANPIGRKFSIDDSQMGGGQVEIVGVASDARDHHLKGPVERRFYLPMTQDSLPVPHLNLEIRTAGNPAAVADAVRKQIKSMDANVPIYSVRTLGELTERMIHDQILIARLSSFFAGVALLLAAIGLYGVLAYSVAGRTREIGIRIALGAEKGSVLRMILQEAGKLVLLGVVIGIPAALLAGKLCSSMLFGLKSSDPESLAFVVAMLLLVALLASYIPARRATKVDPMVALRVE